MSRQMSRQRSRQRSRQISIQDERVLPVESWGDLQRYFITNHQERMKGVKKYEKEFLTRHKKRQKTWSKKKVTIPLRQIEDLGRFSFRKHTIIKREEYLAERKDYEQKYLHRCTKKQNDKPKRSPSKEFDLDLISGRLNLREHVEEKRKELQAERNVYEKEYLARYLKQQKTKLKISALERKLRSAKIELEKPKPNIKQKRREYEKEYITRYSKKQKAKPNKKVFAIR